MDQHADLASQFRPPNSCHRGNTPLDEDRYKVVQGQALVILDEKTQKILDPNETKACRHKGQSRHLTSAKNCMEDILLGLAPSIVSVKGK